jgi:hypothetical protein
MTCKCSRYALGYDPLFELYLEQKLPGFGGVVSIVGDRSAKLKQLIITQLSILRGPC